jgi:hypothetical protein
MKDETFRPIAVAGAWGENERPAIKVCRKCGKTFETKHRAKKRCDACAALVEQALRLSEQEAVYARRANRGTGS